MPAPRKPTHLKLVAGTAQKCRINAKEPKPPRGVPAAPKHLRPRARAAWASFARLLDEIGVLTKADGVALEMLCGAYCDLLEARDSLARPIMSNAEPDATEIAAAGSTTYVSFGQNGPMVRKRPEVAMIADADRRVSMWLAKFGLTPADLSRVSSSKSGGDGKNPFANLH